MVTSAVLRAIGVALSRYRAGTLGETWSAGIVSGSAVDPLIWIKEALRDGRNLRLIAA